MKLKVNTQILFALILFTALAMSSCTPHREEWGGHQSSDPNAVPSDTFWNANVHTFLVIPTAAVLIVDEKGQPVSQAGVIVSANFGMGNVLKSQTNSSGAASVQILGLTYPLSFTASDGGVHEFSTVTVQQPPLPSPIKIVESGTTTTSK